MRRIIKDCYEVTQQLLSLSSKNPDAFTDEDYNQIVLLLDRRESLLPQIKPPFSQDEAKIGTVIIKYNKDIDKNLVMIKSELQQKIIGMKKKEKTAKTYLGYNTPTNDGMFYDRKN